MPDVKFRVAAEDVFFVEWNAALTARMGGDVRRRGHAVVKAPVLKEVHFTCVLTSPRLRARTTCELAGSGGTAAVDPDLAEWDYGEDEGLRTGEIQALRPDWDIWRDGWG